MKLTDSENIKSNESEFIDGLIGELDWQAIETILKEKYRLTLHDDVEFKTGDIVVHGKHIAYKLDFDVRVTLSLIVGRDGECIDIKASGRNDADEDNEITDFPAMQRHLEPEDDEGEVPSGTDLRIRQQKEELRRKNDELALQLSDMIKDINQ